MNFRACVLITVLLSTPACAQWSEQTRSTEMASCVAACDQNNPTRHDTCVAGCRCIMDTTIAQFPDHDQLQHEILVEKRPDRIAAYQTIVDGCNRQTFGGAARKLDIK
jgi:hypothetical protein